ncbi:MAG: hypothetical protein U0793_12975 [Gemmataceae bacterium]
METSALPPDVKAAMEEAIRHAMTGKGDPQVLQHIRDEAERIRKEVYAKHGTLDIGVPAIRELRNGLPE